MTTSDDTKVDAKPSVLKWLEGNCQRLTYDMCSTRACLRRGGHVLGTPNYNAATCEAFEAHAAVQSLPNMTAERDDYLVDVRHLTEERDNAIETIRTLHTEVSALSARVKELEAQNMTYGSALHKCAQTFRYYESLHAAKPDPVKAKANGDIAETIERLLDARTLIGKEPSK